MSSKILLVVLDGLRRDLISPACTPRIHALAKTGVTFLQHHAVFPSVTRVNSASLATGCSPGAHGLVDNVLYLPDLGFEEPVDTGDHRSLLDMRARNDGSLLDVSTLTETVAFAGMEVAVATSCSSGACILQNPSGAGTTVNPGFMNPAEDPFLAALPPVPRKDRPAEKLNAWAVNAMVHRINRSAPDLGIVWLCDPDHTQHGFGPGAAESMNSIKSVDACVGRLVDVLADSVSGADTDLVVMSDHGWISYRAPLTVKETLAAEGFPPGSSGGPVVVGQGIYCDDGDVSSIVECVRSVTGMGAIFTRCGVAGTLLFGEIDYEHARCPDILYAPAWDHGRNVHGLAGMS